MSPEMMAKAQALLSAASPLVGALMAFGVIPTTKTTKYLVGGLLVADLVVMGIPNVRYAFATARRGAE